MQSRRRIRRSLRIGQRIVGGEAPITVESMTKTPTQDADATKAQIKQLEEVGCEIVRIAVPDENAVSALPHLRDSASIPLVADIHFRPSLALLSIEAGVHGVRVNPGNIGGVPQLLEIARAAANHGVSLRIGVNAGSLEKDLLVRYGHPTAEALAESAMRSVDALESHGVGPALLSAKSSSVITTIETYRILADRTDYPLHIGITEAGAGDQGIVRSSIGIGLLLAEGLGDTLRVSLTGDPRREVIVGYHILRSLGLRERGPNVISCPTCGRAEIDVASLAQVVELELAAVVKPITIAVMGCPVNGPGEAREADVGLAGGRGVALIFRKGEVVGKVPEAEAVSALLREARLILEENG